MNNALYVGLSRQMTLQRQMNVIANNIANSDTVGFKVESLMLREDSSRAPMKPSPGSAPPEKITFVHDVGVSIDFTQGALKQTGSTVRPRPARRRLLPGADAQRQSPDPRRPLQPWMPRASLVDISGNLVLSNGGQPIRIDPTKTAPSIGRDGTISQDGVIAGKVGAFKVADRSPARQVGRRPVRSRPRRPDADGRSDRQHPAGHDR